MITTHIASGKSLCFFLPVINAMIMEKKIAESVQ